MILVVPGQTDEPQILEVDVATPTPVYTWTAPWLARTWDLTDITSPVVKIAGALGIDEQVEPDHRWAESSQIDGATWSGSRTSTGEVFMPVMVQGPDLDTFMSERRAFMASLDPAHEGVLRVTMPDATWREALCRFSSNAATQSDINPFVDLYSTYGITWTTADPYWRGEPVTARFAYPDPPPAFFTGPPFRLAPSEVLGASSITNPGDVDAYAVWRVEGPFSSFSVGIGTALVTMPLTKPLGGWVEIDMNPTRLTILDESGADLWVSATEVVFDAIPPGETTLATVVTGAAPGSAVSVSFTPRYRRAW